MKDLIERQAAIESIRECAEAAHDNHEWDMEQGYWNAIECIEEEPSEQSEQPWIPCSEGLPDRFDKMLVTFIPAAGTLWTRVIIANYSDLMGISKPCFWIGNVGKNDFANITSQVVAWMPLPEPYSERRQE